MDKNFYLRKAKALVAQTPQELIDETNRRSLFETELWNAVENGDYEKLLEVTKDGLPSVIWKRQLYGDNCERPFETLRPEELHDVMTIFLAICSRYAIRGGASPIEVRAVEDLIRNDFKNNVSLSSLVSLIDVCAYSMIYLVNQNKSAEPPVVKKVKRYVKTNVYKPLSVSSVANALRMNAHTLSTSFSKNAETSLKKFILAEKCEEAKRLLKETGKTLSDIAEELCFSSQAHFQRTFKEYVGCTPRDFRN